MTAGVAVAAGHDADAGSGDLHREELNPMVLRAFVLLVLALLGAAMWLAPRFLGPPDLQVRVESDGSAVFLGVTPDRQRLWVVSCPVPLRHCVARGDGAVVRLDAEGRPWIAVAAPMQTSLEVRLGPFRRDASAILHGPVSSELLALLDREAATLVISDRTGPVQRLSLGGIARVVDYLGWLQRPAVWLAHDARGWPDGAVQEMAERDPMDEERMKVLAIRLAAGRS
jgi:hypothetical protein